MGDLPFSLGGPPPPVSAPPEVTNITPTPGTQLQKNDPVSFDITDDEGLRRVFVAVRFQKLGVTEMVHDGSGFTDLYAGSPNQRISIPNGYRYNILRRNGWPDAPTVTAYAEDTEGQENA